MSQSTLFNKLKSQQQKSSVITSSNSSNKFIKTTNPTTTTITTTTTTPIINQKQTTTTKTTTTATNPTIISKSTVKISQCAEALAGNRYYSTNPGYIEGKPYLGPPGTLNEVVKLEKLQQEDVKTIKEIWVQYHSLKDCLCAVIPAATYKKMIERAKQNPLFVFPLPGDKGYISILYQNQGDHFVYTYLEQYKKHSINAVPWLIATHYTDLIESKGIVLMRADPNFEVLNSTQATYLYQQTQMYLLDDNRYPHLQMFNHHPSKFSFDIVIKDMESLTLADKTGTFNKSNNNNNNNTTSDNINEIDMTKNVIEFKELSIEEAEIIEKKDEEKVFEKEQITLSENDSIKVDKKFTVDSRQKSSTLD